MTEAELTDAQRTLVRQGADVRLLVTAEPGTGKTFCLVRRIEWLIEEEGLDAADILVLSFSRAAVQVIRDRLAEHGDAGADVGVRTFDSFATAVLADADSDGSWRDVGFDGRIKEATRLLRDTPQAVGLLEDIRHVIVDEVQDLVDVRAELVKALVEQVRGGFTLLGDPAQGIYGFQLEDRQARLHGSAALYAWIRARFDDDLIELELNENHRAREPEALIARPFGAPLAGVDADFARLQRDLRTALLQTFPLGSLRDAAPVMADMIVPTAVLCRTNGQALLVSRELRRQGVAHRLQRSAQDRVLPSWVAHVFAASPSSRPSRNDVQAILDDLDASVPPQAWSLLKRMDPDRASRSLDLAAVRERLAAGNVPDELTRDSDGTLVVSTIHRAKGMEFEQVIVVDPEDAAGDLVDQAENARTLYVAMTRPRDILMYVDPVAKPTGGRGLKKFRNRRWAECGTWRDQQWKRFGIQVLGGDVHTEDPPGTVGFDADAAEVQDYLATRVRPGDEVSLIAIDGLTTGDAPGYAVQHGDQTIGVTSQSFAVGLHDVFGRTSRRHPERIDEIHVECVETVVGRAAAGENAGLGRWGVWLSPRLVGLGGIKWGKDDRE